MNPAKEDKGVQVGITLGNETKLLKIKSIMMRLTLNYMKDYSRTQEQLKLFEDYECFMRQKVMRRRARKIRAQKAEEERRFWSKSSKKYQPNDTQQHVTQEFRQENVNYKTERGKEQQCEVPTFQEKMESDQLI